MGVCIYIHPLHRNMEIQIFKGGAWPFSGIDERGVFKDPRKPLRPGDRILKFKVHPDGYIKFDRRKFLNFYEHETYLKLKIFRAIKPKYKVGKYKLKYQPYENLHIYDFMKYQQYTAIDIKNLPRPAWSTSYRKVKMPVGTFLLLCTPIPPYTWVERVRVQVKIQLKYSSELYLELVCRRGRVVDHEGRHRALAFAYLQRQRGKSWQKAFAKKVTVLVHGDFEGYILAQEGSFKYTLKMEKTRLSESLNRLLLNPCVSS